MKLSEFGVGKEFMSGDRRWRCTDVGRRVVVAIRVDRVSVARAKMSRFEPPAAPIGGAKAEADGWFAGPPYKVAEIAFDEDEQAACFPAA